VLLDPDEQLLSAEGEPTVHLSQSPFRMSQPDLDCHNGDCDVADDLGLSRLGLRCRNVKRDCRVVAQVCRRTTSNGLPERLLRQREGGSRHSASFCDNARSSIPPTKRLSQHEWFCDIPLGEKYTQRTLLSSS